nr:unnamed protein product [Callosobruchus chinensis]
MENVFQRLNFITEENILTGMAAVLKSGNEGSRTKCGEAVETAKHLIFDCPALCRRRSSYLEVVQEEGRQNIGLVIPARSDRENNRLPATSTPKNGFTGRLIRLKPMASSLCSASSFCTFYRILGLSSLHVGIEKNNRLPVLSPQQILRLTIMRLVDLPGKDLPGKEDQSRLFEHRSPSMIGLEFSEYERRYIQAKWQTSELVELLLKGKPQSVVESSQDSELSDFQKVLVILEDGIYRVFFVRRAMEVIRYRFLQDPKHRRRSRAGD